MADLFSKDEAIKLLQGKFILIMGDSNTRALYNDLIYLLQHNDIVPIAVLRKHTKNAKQCEQIDKVVRKNSVTNATRYIEEVREYHGARNICVRFNFITRVLGSQMRNQLEELESGRIPLPNIVIMNSCPWDICRWGAMQEPTYKLQCTELFTRLRALLPPDALVIWNTTLPLADNNVRGGFSIKQLDFINENLRFIGLEANLFISELCKVFHFDLLDMHYHMRFQLSRRCSDGVHWEPHAMRHMTCVLLTHIALSYEMPLPNSLQTNYLNEAVANAQSQLQDECRLDASVLDDVQRIVNKEMSRCSPSHDLHQQLEEDAVQAGSPFRKRSRRRSSTTENVNLIPIGCPAIDGAQATSSSVMARLDRDEPTSTSLLSRLDTKQLPSSPLLARLESNEAAPVTPPSPSRHSVRQRLTFAKPSVNSQQKRLSSLDVNKIFDDAKQSQSNENPVIRRETRPTKHTPITVSQITFDSKFPVNCQGAPQKARNGRSNFSQHSESTFVNSRPQHFNTVSVNPFQRGNLNMRQQIPPQFTNFQQNCNLFFNPQGFTRMYRPSSDCLPNIRFVSPVRFGDHVTSNPNVYAFSGQSYNNHNQGPSGYRR